MKVFISFLAGIAFVKLVVSIIEFGKQLGAKEERKKLKKKK